MTVASRARRAARDSRAASADGTALRWPGATNKFALFAEVLYTGLLIAIVALPLVTLPLALAVGIRHLRRFVLDEESSVASAWADVRAGFARSLPVGLALLGGSAVVALDLVLASTGALPGGIGVAVVLVLALVAALVVLVGAAADWAPGARWLPLLRASARHAATDARSTSFLVVALLLTALITWQLAPLIVPCLGCLAFAALALRLARD
ncbi:hypothetical protein HQQ80_03920 [Microbacteriaceae bacterium VKM Ac-2855]|nr:hypothetical protein [Microbacteriaceae bacterium VKM Ac-2855]